MAAYYGIQIKSNDGQTELTSYTEYNDPVNVLIKSDGVSLSTEADQYYTYSGTKTFAGLAIDATATTATYAVGSSFNLPVGSTTYYIVEGGGSSMINIDLTTLSGYSTLTKGQTYSLTVKAKASGYQDSDASAAVSYTVPQPTLAAPVITASDTTITWDAVENADSYDVYVDDTLYENVTGDTVYDITTTVTNGTYSGDTTITDTATVTITANSGYTLPDTVTVTGASQSWNKETGTLTLTNPTGAVTVSAACVAASYTLEAGTYKWVDGPVKSSSLMQVDFNFVSNQTSFTRFIAGTFGFNNGIYYRDSTEEEVSVKVYNWTTWTDTAYQTITLSTDQTVSAEFYEWAITGGNLVKQEGETWVLNETIPLSYQGTGGLSADFISNSENFIGIDFDEKPNGVRYKRISDKLIVYTWSDDQWTNQAYRTITFQTPPTGDLLTWLQANGTKQ